jgi:AraC-like DNA-binding protein
MHPHISILTIFLAILMAYRNWNINRNTIFLSGFIFVFALYSLIHYVLLISKDVFLLAVFYNNNAPIGFLVGPLLYFYVRGTLFDNKKLNRKDLLHLIPALINSISITPYVLTPFSYKLDLANRLVKDTMVARTVTVGLYPNIVNMIARPTLLCIYTISALVMIFHFYRKNKGSDRIPKKQTRNMMIWLFSFITIICFAVICFAVLSYLFLREPNPNLALLKTCTPMNVVGFCLLMIPVSLLIFPEILYGIPQVDEKPRVYLNQLEQEDKQLEIKDSFLNAVDLENDPIAIAEMLYTIPQVHEKAYVYPVQSGSGGHERIELKNSLTDETNIQENQVSMAEITSAKVEKTNGIDIIDKDIEPRFIELSESILVHIRESKIFLNPDFSMEELSRSMKVPKHHLYYCFNSILNVKLTKIRAELRVEYAKKLIEEGLTDSLTLDAIGGKAGFSSRSSFQSTFKEIVGSTPGEYLKALSF